MSAACFSPWEIFAHKASSAKDCVFAAMIREDIFLQNPQDLVINGIPARSLDIHHLQSHAIFRASGSGLFGVSARCSFLRVVACAERLAPGMQLFDRVFVGD